jgi:large subunit ribosomal protein L24
MSGKCKGQYGKIIGVRRDINSVLISGLNLVKRHLQPAPNASEEERRRGNIVQIENPIHISNVALIDPSTKYALNF